MSTDPINRLPLAFGRLLQRRLHERKWTITSFADASRLPEQEAIEMLHGHREPTLTEFFRAARALGESEPLLLTDVIAEWLDRSELLRATRASDFDRLYRLGYYRNPRDFRELAPAYNHNQHAASAAAKLNIRRLERGLALLNTISVYVRLDTLQVDLRAIATAKEKTNG